MFRDEVSPTGDGGRDDYPSVSLRDPAPLTRGARFFLRKGALIHRHAEVMRALQANKNLPKRNCFPEGSNSFHSYKLEFVFALLITLIQQEQNFWLEFFSYIVNIVLQYGIRSISVSFQ